MQRRMAVAAAITIVLGACGNRDSDARADGEMDVASGGGGAADAPGQKSSPAARGGAGGATNLAGTGWMVYRNGARNGQNMLFCANGHWEVVLPRGIGPTGKWRRSGGTLTITADDGSSQKWRVREISADELELDDGSGPIRLRERGPTTC